MPFYPCNNSYDFIRAPSEKPQRRFVPLCQPRCRVERGEVECERGESRETKAKIGSRVLKLQPLSGETYPWLFPGGQVKKKGKGGGGGRGGRTGVWKPSWSLHAPSECQPLRSSVCCARGKRRILQNSWAVKFERNRIASARMRAEVSFPPRDGKWIDWDRISSAVSTGEKKN